MILNKPDTAQAIQVGNFLICVFLALQITSGLDGTEFGGGWFTGPLLSMADLGIVLFILAAVLTFLFPRVGAAIVLASSLLCLPLYCFFIAPAPFAQLFVRGHEFKVQPVPGFQWHSWPAINLLAVVIAVYVCIRRLAFNARIDGPATGAD